MALSGATQLAFAQEPAFRFELIGSSHLTATTTAASFHVLGRTEPTARVTVNDLPASVFSTGVFVRDAVPLTMGRNSIVLRASFNSDALTRTLSITRLSPPVAVMPRWPENELGIDAPSAEPRGERVLHSSEPLDASVRATPGMLVDASLFGGPWERLVERTTAQGTPLGLYVGSLTFSGDGEQTAKPVAYRVRAMPGSALANAAEVQVLSSGRVGLWSKNVVRMVVVGDSGADLLWGLHEVRLGGPNLAELPAATFLRIDGRVGDFYRVRLTPDSHAWVAVKSVLDAPPGTAVPKVAFTNLSVIGGALVDKVFIPYQQPVPYAVRTARAADGKAALEIDFFGGHNASTWNAHRGLPALVYEVEVTQVATDHVRVRVSLNDKRLWGYSLERVGGALVVSLRKAPPAASDAARPLQGVHVALEPGHGSPVNPGAFGATGAMEKDVNRATVVQLKLELERVGAIVTVVREGDENPTQRERARRAEESGAALFVSVHANSAPTDRGYLRVGGTSTFYKHPFSRDLAEIVHRRMLAHTGLDDFGFVGAFNYAPIRLVTWMPAVLVEQAFISNPGEEAQLLDPVFRAKMAVAIREGLEAFMLTR